MVFLPHRLKDTEKSSWYFTDFYTLNIRNTEDWSLEYFSSLHMHCNAGFFKNELKCDIVENPDISFLFTLRVVYTLY